MTKTLPSLLGALSLALAGAVLPTIGCDEQQAGTTEATGTMREALSAAHLTPPTPFVLASDGVTKQTLVQAGIVKPTGARWAVVLGKALFWDEQAGSDGQACASCHFNAGADTRLRNQINPDFDDVTMGPNGDSAFGSQRSDTGAVLPGHMPSGAVAGPNYELVAADLPLHRLVDETNRNSPIVTTTNDRVGSQGAFAATFEHIGSDGEPDVCDQVDASIFHVGRLAARQVEARNTPSFQNAVFNFRNFWDNRANNLFNGVGVFGMRDVSGDPRDPTDPRNDERLVILENGAPKLGYLMVENASLASQALAPPPNSVEMSCAGRTFADVGRKLLSTTPLRDQRVSEGDSVLGPYVGHGGVGLRDDVDYATLIRATFDAKYWALPGRYRITEGRLVEDPHGYTQMELNFSMFWGLAIAAYESTQVADESEFDALQAEGRLVMTPSFTPAGPSVGGCTAPGGDVDPLLVRGCTIFARFNVGPFVPTPPDGIRGGNCFVCHDAQGGGVGRTTQPLLTEGTFQEGENFALFLTFTDVNNFNDLRDQGSANIGLQPAFSDQLSGRVDDYGNPLSFGRQYWNYLNGDADALLDPPLQRALAAGALPARVPVGGATPGNTFRKLEVDGASKAPILRDVALTPPYFSSGGSPTLRHVLKVYNRGVNRRDIAGPGSREADGNDCTSGDSSGTGPDGNQAFPVSSADCNTNTTGVILPLGLLDCDANGETNPACVAAGRTTADDDLAALERFLKSLTDRRVQCDVAPFDHPELHVLDGEEDNGRGNDGRAEDRVFTLPAVGAAGYAPSSGYCIPNAGDLFAPGMQARSGGARVPLR